MKIVHINEHCGLSTGTVAKSIINSCQAESYLFYTYGQAEENYAYKFYNKFGYYFDKLMTRITGIDGVWSFKNTKRIIKKLDEIKPDIIHLHNLHGFYLNYPMLFKYIKRNNVKVIWTLHDCWSFTGHCTYFDYVGCCNWKSHCGKCPMKNQTRLKSWFFDNSSNALKIKKSAFTGVRDLTIVTPSIWLADLVKQSFLKGYPIKVINNGIDLSVFKPTKSSFKSRYNLENKFVILGVASTWDMRKGLDVFTKISKLLNERYKIVMVGTDDNVDKQLSDDIISIHRTQNQTELAEIYTAADLFVNPTREDNYPTVNMESLACGTPVLTFKTGGSPECLNETCGCIVTKEDINAMCKEIERICEKRPYTEENCLQIAKSFDRIIKNQEYNKLYNFSKGANK